MYYSSASLEVYSVYYSCASLEVYSVCVYYSCASLEVFSVYYSCAFLEVYSGHNHCPPIGGNVVSGNGLHWSF